MGRTQDLVAAGLTARLASLLNDGYTPVTSPEELNIAIGDSTTTQGVVVTHPITLKAHTTISRPLKIVKGGTISTGGFNLTINGWFEAGGYQCFAPTASGQVTFGAGAVDWILPEWFGALGDNSTDDTNAFAYAFGSHVNCHSPIRCLEFKNYRISNLTVPERTRMYGVGLYNSCPTIKANTTGVMFTLPNGETFCKFENLILNGNSTAGTVIDVNGCQYVHVEGCYFLNATIGVDHTDSAYFNQFKKNKFHACGTSIKFSGSSNYIMVKENNFSGAQTYCIQCDSSYAGDMLAIEDNAFEATGCTDYINLSVTSGVQGKNASIVRNRFDGSPSNSCIYIDDEAMAVICENSFGSNATHIKIDGVDCWVDNNAMFGNGSNVGIVLGSSSARNRVGEQRWGTGGVAVGERVTDSGSGNIVLRQVIKRVGVVVPLTNSAAETDIATITLLADSLWRNRIARIRVYGSLFNNTGAANGVTFKAKFDGTTAVTDANMSAVASHATDLTIAELEFWIQNNNSQANQSSFYKNTYEKGATGVANAATVVEGGNAMTIDTTADRIMKITAQLSAASANLTWNTNGYTVEYL